MGLQIAKGLAVLILVWITGILTVSVLPALFFEERTLIGAGALLSAGPSLVVDGVLANGWSVRDTRALGQDFYAIRIQRPRFRLP